MGGEVNDCKSSVYNDTKSLKTKTKRAAALLLLLALLAPWAARAQSPDCNEPITITADAPYIEDFESPEGTAWDNAGPLPDCWEGYNDMGFVPHNSTNEWHSGSQSLSFSGNYSRLNCAILPQFSVSLNRLQISFWRKGIASFKLGYITADDDGSCNTFTELANLGGSNWWVQHKVELNTLPAEAHRLVFNCSTDEFSYIDDVEVNILPVYNLRGQANLSSNSALLNWDLGDENQTEWNVQVASNAAFTESVINHVANTNENYQLNGLNPGTYYYVRVKPTYSDDLWSNTIFFATSCDTPVTVAENAPYTEGFESPQGSDYNIAGYLPDCWGGYSTGALNPHNCSTYGISGLQSLVFPCEGSDIYPLWNDYYAILPQFTNPINELQISFMKMFGYDNHFQLGYITYEDDGTCNTFTAIKTYNRNGSFTTYLPSVPSTARRLVFKFHSNDDVCYIDDVEVAIAPPGFCYPVGNLSVGEVTIDSAFLSWGLIDDSQTAWDVQVATSADFTENVTNHLADIHENFLIDGLSGSTTYYVRVRANCDDDHQSEWSDTFDFTTLCDPIEITAETPYLEGFESPEGTLWTEQGPLPPCWVGYNSVGYPAPHNTIGSDGASNYVHSGAQSLSFHNHGDSYAVLPEFSNLLNQLQVSFWMSTEGTGSGQLRLGYITADDDGTCNTFVEIASYNNNEGSMVQRTTYLPNVPATAARLVFKWSATYYRCFVDDVEMSINPAMIPPHNIAAVNITPNSADITWEGYCDSYALRYREIPTLLKEGFEGGTMPEGWTIEGINQDPATTWRVGLGDHSGTTGTHSGDYNALITHNTTNQATYLVTPALDLGEYASAELSFWYVNREWSDRTDEFAVCYRIGNEGEWNELWSTAENHEVWTSQTVALTGLGDNYQIGFRFTDHYGWGVGLDDIALCAPTHFDWIPDGNAPSPHTLTGLTPETTYEVQLQGTYGSTIFDWSESVTFTTLEACPVPDGVEVSDIAATSAAVSWTGFSDSYNLSYRRAPSAGALLSEGFEGGTMPDGWTIEGDNQDPAKTWRVGVGDYSDETGTHSGNYNALITHNTSGQVTYLVTPALDLGDYGSAELSFWYVNGKWVNDIDEFAVCYRIGNEGEWNVLWSTDVNHDIWTSQTVELTGLANNYQIGFRFTDGYGYGVALDDIVLFDPTLSEWITLSEAESPQAIVGLTPETEYEVKVQGVCDGEATNWSEAVAFTTLEATTFTKEIAGYGESNGGYYLIASPVAEPIVPSEENGFLANEYDLYYFDQSEELEWRNHKNWNFNLENGTGYLYANSEDVTLTFIGTPYAATEPVEVALAYDPAASFAGWNLVGNPFGQTAYIGKPFYAMNSLGTEIIPATGNSVGPMEGIFVVAEEDGETVAFSTTAPETQSHLLSIDLIEASTSRNAAPIDRAIIRFGDSQTLPKFQLNANSTNVYIPQGGKDYAIVSAGGRDGACTVSAVDNVGTDGGTNVGTDGACTVSTMPINFKANENGTYTLVFNLENLELDYLHLIDNLTGADVDLLAANGGRDAMHCVSTYTFTAKTTDYASRFHLVFSGPADGPSANQPFAYIANDEIIINDADARSASLQVVDVMGRIVVCRDGVHTVSTSGMPAGVYVLRLVNGDSVRTQKIVIE